MDQTPDLHEIYASVLTREFEGQARMVQDPSGFLEELAVLTDEPNDEVLRNMLTGEIQQVRIWGRIFLLASELRDKNSHLWEQCEPVIRRFLERVDLLVFRQDNPNREILRETVYKNIFG